MKKYLIIGNGIAGTTAAEEIRKHDTDGHITLITRESLPLYSRIRLPDFLCGKIGEHDLIIKNQEWHDKRNIKLMTCVEIEKIDFQEKKIFFKKRDNKANPAIKDTTQDIDIEYDSIQNNSVLEFDSLLLAVGSNSFIPPVKGNDLGVVMSLRTVDDAKSLIKKAMIKIECSIDSSPSKETDINTNSNTSVNSNTREVVVIGGGLLGIEAAAAMIHAGIKVTVVEFCDRLLPRQLDYQGAKLLQMFLEKMGFVLRLGEATEEIIGKVSEPENGQQFRSSVAGLNLKPEVEGVKLKSGDIIKADTVLFSAGVRPDLSLVLNSEIKISKAIIVNERMETSVPSVYAAGDVAEYQGVNFCIWPEAMEQGRVAGINMAGGSAEYKNIPPSNMLKVAGIAVASAGEIDVDGKMDADIVSTESVYRKIVRANNGKIVGCIMVGDTADFNKIVKEIKGE